MTRPRDHDEVHAIQIAIRPTFDDFAHLTGKVPKVPNAWLSYKEQMDDMQRQLGKVLCRKQHDENISLPRLAQWRGGIDRDEIEDQVRQRISTKKAFERLDVFQQAPIPNRKYCTEWYRTNEVPRPASHFQESCKDSRAPEASIEHRSVDSPQEARLNRLVAKDHEAYKCWLNTVGLTFYQNEHWGDKQPETWDYWCRYIAPVVFDLHGKTIRREDSIVNSKTGPAAESLDRPIISLEQAKRARIAWRASKGESRISFEGCTLLHAIKGTNPVFAGSGDNLRGKSAVTLDGSHTAASQGAAKFRMQP